MKFIKSIAVVAQTLAFIALGTVLVLLSLNLFSSDQIENTIQYITEDPTLRFIVALAGAILILGGLINANLSLAKLQMEKTIAFENPEGQVTVSLTAVEDFVKKSVRHITEVKELRSSVTASKKGINVMCRATLYADSNIPETTERIQNIVKSRVREMLGVEETINIKINVNKIASRGKGEVKNHAKERDEFSRRMPLGSID